MYLNIGQGNALSLGNIGGFSNHIYWSSTEYDPWSADLQDFLNGQQGEDGKNTPGYYVRAIRAF